MKLSDQVKRLEVFYDGHCGMCCTFHEWLNQQERGAEVDFIPYQSARAAEVFPRLHEQKPEHAMVVRTDDGAVYRAAEAWVWCLWSCLEFRDLAQKLSHPRFLGLAEMTCRVLVANRQVISKLFFRGSAKRVADRLHEMPKLECDSDHCGNGD